MMQCAIYAGTFDPITLGHFDVLQRASRIFDKVVIAIVRKSNKSAMFSAEERLAMASDVASGFENVEADCFDGLLVEYARERKVNILIRGLRAYSDFEYEFQMALTNRKLAPELETMFLMPKDSHSYLSSSVVREVVELGGDIEDFVPQCVEGHIRRRFPIRKTGEE
jgi:pantetheine-phosphate adenylyltransferase